MDAKDIRNLSEAYMEVYAPQEELDEGVTLAQYKRKREAHKSSQSGGGSSRVGLGPAGSEARVERDMETRGAFGTGEYGGTTKNPKKLRKQKAMGEIGEQVDIYDIILSHLLDEGYADTEDAATAIMVNMSEEWRESIVEEMLDEAEGSYGQTPKARAAMGKLAIARREKPASEYSQKGEKTKKVKAIEKHTQRIDNGPDAGNRGKKSTKPRWSGYLGAKGRGKMDQDSRDWSRERDVEYSAGENKPGSGSVTKNPKKLRKQKAMGEHD